MAKDAGRHLVQVKIEGTDKRIAFEVPASRPLIHRQDQGTREFVKKGDSFKLKGVGRIHPEDDPSESQKLV